MDKPQFIIDGDLLQTLANYLAERPFREVAALMHAIQTCERVETPQATQQGN